MVTSKKPATPSTTTATAKAPKLVVVKPSEAPSAAPKVKPVASAEPEGPKKGVARKPKSALSSPSAPALSAAQRAHYVEVAAFYIAERRGFAGANPADDWVAAEAEIDRMIASGHFAL